MQDVNNVNGLGLPGDAVENLVAAMNPMPHAAIFVARHEREREGHVCRLMHLLCSSRTELQRVVEYRERCSVRGTGAISAGDEAQMVC